MLNGTYFGTLLAAHQSITRVLRLFDSFWLGFNRNWQKENFCQRFTKISSHKISICFPFLETKTCFVIIRFQQPLKTDFEGRDKLYNLQGCQSHCISHTSASRGLANKMGQQSSQPLTRKFVLRNSIYVLIINLLYFIF